MPSHLFNVALPLAGLLALLVACRKEVPTPPVPPTEPVPKVTPSTDLRGASDHPQAPGAVGAVAANQDSGGAQGQAMEPTSGDGRAASAASGTR